MNQNVEKQTERCVLCHAVVTYRVDTPVSEREHYIVGCGQLCEKCYEQLKQESKNTVHFMVEDE